MARWYGSLIASLTTALPLLGAPAPGSFAAKAERLFHRDYFFHPWQETDHTVDGEDWSLPPWVAAARYSGISINPAKVPAQFPGRLQRTVRVSWRELEPRPGDVDFSTVRRRILEASAGGVYSVRFSLLASVWETRYFRSLKDHAIVRTTPGSAPLWLAECGIERIEEKPNRSIPFQVVNLDIYDPDYHRRYLALVAALGRSGIAQMPELDLCYVHLVSASRGEEGRGPDLEDPRRRLYEERLRAWAAAFKGVEYKLCHVSHRAEDMELAVSLGMGQRNGFVEHYMLHAPNPGLGQLLDADGYLVTDETHPLIAENRASGDENEEYTANHEARFGPIETFPHRYHESMLRALQMRRNFLWAEGGPWLVNPPLLHYVALELGKTVSTAPDAWCYLRESWVPDRAHGNWKKAVPVKNFERWLYQRDVDGARTRAVAKVPVPAQMFEFHRDHLYDCTARSTQAAEGQTLIRFAVDDRFLAGGPHRVAVKVSYLDEGDAQWTLEYATPQGQTSAPPVTCHGTGGVRTATFILPAACFSGSGYRGLDLAIRARRGDAVIRLVRIVKLTLPPAARGAEGGR